MVDEEDDKPRDLDQLTEKELMAEAVRQFIGMTLCLEDIKLHLDDIREHLADSAAQLESVALDLGLCLGDYRGGTGKYIRVVDLNRE